MSYKIVLFQSLLINIFIFFIFYLYYLKVYLILYLLFDLKHNYLLNIKAFRNILSQICFSSILFLFTFSQPYDVLLLCIK